jgi:hypothetical protein
MIEQSNEEWLAAYIAVEALERAELHANHASNRPLSDGFEFVGLTGEFEFGRLVGLMPDLERRAGGDKGVDFVVTLRFTLDVKTARKAGNLIHEQGKPFADIYVLAEFMDSTNRANVVGWEWGSILAKAPVKDFGYGIRNHYIPRDRLRPMGELVARCTRLP